MSKLHIIGKALEENPSAEICSLEEKIFAKNSYPHFVEYLVAPKEPCFDADKLNEFMKQLVPIEPSFIYNSTQDKSRLYFGCLCFDERIGQEYTFRQRAVLIEDEYLKFLPELAKYEKVLSEDSWREYKRRINIHIYPCAEIAEDLIHGHSHEEKHSHGGIEGMPELSRNSIALHELDHYKPKSPLWKRILRIK